jgi:hypothetical protein
MKYSLQSINSNGKRRNTKLKPAYASGFNDLGARAICIKSAKFKAERRGGWLENSRDELNATRVWFRAHEVSWLLNNTRRRYRSMVRFDCMRFACQCMQITLYPERARGSLHTPSARRGATKYMHAGDVRSKKRTRACIVTQILCIVESAGDGINSLVFSLRPAFIIQFCRRCNRRIACASNAISDVCCHIAYPHESVDWVANWARTARADQKRDQLHQDHLQE